MKEEYQVTTYNSFGKIMDSFILDYFPPYHRWGALVLKDNTTIKMPSILIESVEGMELNIYEELRMINPKYQVNLIALDGSVIKQMVACGLPATIENMCNFLSVKRKAIMMLGNYIVTPLK